MGHCRFCPLLETKQGFTAALLITVLIARDVIYLRLFLRCDTLRYHISTFISQTSTTTTVHVHYN